MINFLLSTTLTFFLAFYCFKITNKEYKSGFLAFTFRNPLWFFFITYFLLCVIIGGLSLFTAAYYFTLSSTADSYQVVIDSPAWINWSLILLAFITNPIPFYYLVAKFSKSRKVLENKAVSITHTIEQKNYLILGAVLIANMLYYSYSTILYVNNKPTVTVIGKENDIAIEFSVANQVNKYNVSYEILANYYFDNFLQMANKSVGSSPYDNMVITKVDTATNRNLNLYININDSVDKDKAQSIYQNYIAYNCKKIKSDTTSSNNLITKKALSLISLNEIISYKGDTIGKVENIWQWCLDDHKKNN